MKALIYLKRAPSQLRSNSSEQRPLRSVATSVSRIILVMPRYATRSKAYIVANASACKALATRFRFPAPPSRKDPVLSRATKPQPP
uniref:Uncharacterized protein n=1 Tax=Arundo donax TaxID=35708 RepID=A0A0A9AB91_ARUDO